MDIDVSKKKCPVEGDKICVNCRCEDEADRKQTG
jgi:hypothetical protein